MINQNKKKIVVLTITLLIAAGFCLFIKNIDSDLDNISEEKDALSAAESNSCMPGLNVSNDVSFLEEKIELIPDTNKGIYYNGVLLPYDADSNTLYLAQTINDDLWHGTLTAEIIGECSIYTISCDNWLQKKESIANNYVFTIWLTNDKAYYEYNLCVTGTPVIWIQNITKDIITMTLFDPDTGTITESRTEFRQKGSSSFYSSKKSYALDLINDAGAENYMSLLGMREGSSWKLNSLYQDPLRIREITAAELWKEIDEANSNIDEPGPVMRYVELLIDDGYDGLYTLVEPMDAEKLKLTDGDALYKIIVNDHWLANDEIMDCILDKKSISSAAEIKFPDTITDYGAAWTPMLDYNSWVYGEEITYEEAVKKVNLENLYDYNVFIMTTNALDNYRNNVYLASRADDTGNNVAYFYLWDLDRTFGVKSDSLYDTILLDALIRLMELNPGEVKKAFANRYFAYRDNILSNENIIGLLEKNCDYLINTGAITREAIRYPEGSYENGTISTDLTEVIKFQTERMDWLDEFFSDMLSEAAE